MEMYNSRRQFIGVPVFLNPNRPFSAMPLSLVPVLVTALTKEKGPYYLLANRKSSVRKLSTESDMKNKPWVKMTRCPSHVMEGWHMLLFK